ncbi:MAG: NAD(P)-dependent oxidoreductase [Alphaproteobacteria bacterium]
MSLRKVGIIGVGSLGSGMAGVMLEDGREVHGFDINAEALRAAEARGVVGEQSPKAVADKSEAVILSLPQSDIVAEVCLGKGGIIETDNPKVLVIDTTSGLPAKTVEIAEKLSARGIRMIDAPITGGEGGGSTAAPNRGITIIVGGEPADVAEARELLESLSKHLFEVGKLGNGHLIKAINNMVGFCAGIATTEGLLVAARHGVSPELAAACMNVGTGQNFHLKRHLVSDEKKPAAGDNKPGGGFQIGLMCKDMRHMSQLAREAGVPAFATDQAFHLAELFTQELGFEAGINEMNDVMERWAGIRVDGSEIE